MKCAGEGVGGEKEENGGFDCDEASNGRIGDKRVVLVGVRLDSQSNELLTWALVKVARSGDRVIALHILNNSENVAILEGQSTLVSLVNTFDSMMAAYEGFCNLKQVDLKLKVCRGASVRKVLVQEAKLYGEASLILGISRVHNRIRSQLTVAKYCARHLPKNFSVLAVENGKIQFERVADTSDEHSKKQCAKKGSKKNKESNVTIVADRDSTEPCTMESKGNSLALVVFKNQKTHASKHRWAFLRKMFLHSKHNSDKKKKTVMQCVYPDQKITNSNKVDHSCTDYNEKNAVVLHITAGADNAMSPLPCHSLDRFSKEFDDLTNKYSSTIRLFSYEELCLATSNFMPVNMIGKGGSSEVYKGHLPDGKEVAVKLLKPSQDAFKQFVSEVETISSLHHNNVISLLGFSVEANHMLLVYDFLSRGSLEENLHDENVKGSMFSWEDRYKVALHVAQALKYLHDECDDPIIHRDVKSSNILLSDRFDAQLADFGLALHGSQSMHDTTTVDVAGTFGYLAPEYFMHGNMNDKIDVYAYGVILLELLSGKKPIDNGNPKGQKSLVMWAKPIVKEGKISELLDPRLGDAYSNEEAERMVLAAYLCTRQAAELRPRISIVLELLQGDANSIKWARQQLSGLEDSEEITVNIQSHINLALVGLEDDSPSVCSTEQNIGVEEYLQGRWSRTSSFD
ncbi:protein kinase STUNTED-like isoform X2 [Impatiens glandulifera]|uniref:protein kinase STUNTED-like isoform X2 n=1 Tax=Impatiens glandulifera TaxID=253017 RepID=UPI001FB10449|nr:protein kinase STUNTED-like isoform X2 [Impatiens glandulifera]